MNATRRLLIPAAAGVLLAGSALAQTAPPNALGNAPGQEQRRGPADHCYQQPPTGGPNQRSDDAKGQNPSRQLSQSQGVVCPPTEIDPKITKPAPERGRTPVIPPPGSPGSGSNIEPK